MLGSGWFFALFDWFAFKELMYASVSLPLFPQATEIFFFFRNLNLNSLHKITTTKNETLVLPSSYESPSLQSFFSTWRITFNRVIFVHKCVYRTLDMHMNFGFEKVVICKDLHAHSKSNKPPTQRGE